MKMAITTKQKQFIERVGQLATADMRASGVLASLTIAQAILESGWGESGLATKANALFGIKAGTSWKGKVYSAKTKECYDGETFEDITATFRAYDSWEESIKDHSALLTGLARYKAVIGEKDYKRACIAIKAAGYATDPAYSEKLIKIIETYGLNKYDTAAASGSGQAPANTTGGNKKMNNKEFIAKLKNVVDNFNTVYMWGVFGAPVAESVITQKTRQYSSWYTVARQAAFRALIGKKYFGFDCVCLIKGILWGWNGDASKTYGGATYASNGVPDVSADGMINKCTDISTDFKKIMPGEAVWLPGHIGVYIGNGKVIECTPIWKNGVQITACLNIGAVAGLNGRKWTKHGKLPYITYEVEEAPGENKNTEESAVPLTVGTVINFTGTKHYASSNAASAVTCKPGKAKITSIAKGAKHPYHLIRESGGGSTVYGWVDVADIEGAKEKPPVSLTVGSIINFAGTKHYTSANATSPKTCKPGKAKITSIAKGAKHPYHLIRESGGGSTVYGWVDTADII
jgi:hypothetical protein